MKLNLKPIKEQFPTFRGSKRDLLHVKALADKNDVSYSTMMQTLLSESLARVERTDLGVGKELLEDISKVSFK